MAFSLGGIAGTGGNCGCCATDTLACFPCPIPKHDLTLTIITTPFTMTYDSGTETWTWDNGFIVFTLQCVGGNIQFTNTGIYSCFTINDFTCDPFHLHYICTPTTDMYIDG